MQRYGYIFFIALALNILWEHAHSFLYVHYQGGAITELILFRAALFDAAVITFVAYMFFGVFPMPRRSWFMAGTLLIFAIVLESWAIGGGRWAYTSAMPIIPLLNTGLTPTIQLALLGYLSVLISIYATRQKN